MYYGNSKIFNIFKFASEWNEVQACNFCILWEDPKTQIEDFLTKIWNVWAVQDVSNGKIKFHQTTKENFQCFKILFTEDRLLEYFNITW